MIANLLPILLLFLPIITDALHDKASGNPWPTPSATPSSVYKRFDLMALTDIRSASHRIQRTAIRQLPFASNFSKPGDNFALAIAALGDVNNDNLVELVALSIDPDANYLVVNIIQLTEDLNIRLLSSFPFSNYSIFSYYPSINVTPNSPSNVHFRHCSISVALVGHRKSLATNNTITTVAMGAPCLSSTGSVFMFAINSIAQPINLQKSYNTYDNIHGHFNSPYFIPLPINGIFVENARFGSSIAHVVDINGDDNPDLVIGSPGESSIYSVFLRDDHITPKSIIRTSTLSELYESFGSSIASIGDVDNDGIMDLLVSSSHTIHLVFLSSKGKVKKSIALQLPINIINHGISLSFVGLDDNEHIVFAIGNQYDNDGGIRKGSLWIVHMDNQGYVWKYVKSSSTQGNMDGNLQNFDHFGASLTTILDDSNKDGTAELLVGIPKPPSFPLVPSNIGSKQRKPGSLWLLDIPQTKSVKLAKMDQIARNNNCIYSSSICTCSFTHHHSSVCLTLHYASSPDQSLCHERYCSGSFRCGK